MGSERFGKLSYELELAGCAQDDTLPDLFSETFIPRSVLSANGIGLTPGILNAVDDELLSAFFVGSTGEDARGGVTLDSFTVQLSFGERQNLTGTATNSRPTGILLRMEGSNVGYGYSGEDSNTVLQPAYRALPRPASDDLFTRLYRGTLQWHVARGRGCTFFEPSQFQIRVATHNGKALAHDGGGFLTGTAAARRVDLSRDVPEAAIKIRSLRPRSAFFEWRYAYAGANDLPCELGYIGTIAGRR